MFAAAAALVFFAAQSPDVEAPLIEDLAVAAANPDAAPVVTAVFSDDVTGVKLAEIYFRALGDAAYEKIEFSAGQSGVFLARLPDGLQRTGFEYYVEVVDAAGNPPARLGSPERPLTVVAATESTADRLARQKAEAQGGGAGIHPAWTMAALGAGVGAGALAGVFWYDWVVNGGQIAGIDETIAASGPTADLQTKRQERVNAQLLDGTFGSLLGVAAIAGIATGVTLLVLSAVAE